MQIFFAEISSKISVNASIIFREKKGFTQGYFVVWKNFVVRNFCFLFVISMSVVRNYEAPLVLLYFNQIFASFKIFALANSNFKTPIFESMNELFTLP